MRKLVSSVKEEAGPIAAFQIKGRNGRARLICVHGLGGGSPVEMENWLIENLEPNRAIRLVGLFDQVEFAASGEHARRLALKVSRKSRREAGLAAAPTALHRIEELVDQVFSRWRQAASINASKTGEREQNWKKKIAAKITDNRRASNQRAFKGGPIS